MEFVILTFMIIGAYFYVSTEVQKLKEKNRDLEEKLSELANVTGNPECSVFYVDNITLNELRCLKENGEIIKAVKRLRDKTGYNLKEAKQYIDKL